METSKKVLLSIFFQSFIHLFALVASTSLVEIEKKQRKKDEEEKFEPNLINSVVFLVGLAIQSNIFAVNYRGELS